MPERNPYQPTSQIDRALRRGIRGRIALAIYSAAAFGFAAFMIGGFLFLDDQGLFFSPGLNQDVVTIAVFVVALACGGCGAMLCAQVLRYQLASRIAVFAVANAFIAFVWGAAFMALGFLGGVYFQIFPRASDSLVPAHYMLLAFTVLAGVFGIGAVVKEIHDERLLLAMFLGIATLLCLLLMAPFLLLLNR